MQRSPFKRKPPKPKSCKWCKDQFEPRAGTQVVCSPSCALSRAKDKAAKDAQRELKAKEREFKAETRRRKEAIKSLAQLCSETQKVVNEYKRLADILKGYKCISCGVRDITDAGHFYHAGTKYRTSRLRFNLLGLNGQCEHCNRYTGGGNQRAHEKGIIERYGQEHMDALEQAKLESDRGEEAPLTKDEVREMKTYYRGKIRGLKKQLGLHGG